MFKDPDPWDTYARYLWDASWRDYRRLTWFGHIVMLPFLLISLAFAALGRAIWGDEEGE